MLVTPPPSTIRALSYAHPIIFQRPPRRLSAGTQKTHLLPIFCQLFQMHVAADGPAIVLGSTSLKLRDRRRIFLRSGRPAMDGKLGIYETQHRALRSWNLTTHLHSL